ncbi:uncharacterized protein LOC120351895 [Nilaparvata lugens]|uniref:uncharacterized protein LOC120351895 n=1 Tax=Nilaparvata lugens TaxID=108931 RepID=UPI00193DD83F|nr:uncharacterized protein LOC120351895 [Nilaparvata lugens]
MIQSYNTPISIASQFAIGAVLSQFKNGADLPIAYASRTLNDTETRYSTIERELLAIVWATKHFRPYLYGRKFNIFTDHKPLQWLFSIKEPNSKMLRWRLKLEEYDYDIQYKKGSKNQNADALSRIHLNNNNTTTQETPGILSDIDAIVNEAIEGLMTIGPNNETTQPVITDVRVNQNPLEGLDDIPPNGESPLFEGFDEDNLFAGFNIENQSVLVNIDQNENRLMDLGEVQQEEEDDQTVHTNTGDNTTAGVQILDEPVNYGKHQVILSLVKYNSQNVKVKKTIRPNQTYSANIRE